MSFKRLIKGTETVLILAVILAVIILGISMSHIKYEKCDVVRSHDGIVTVLDKYGEYWTFTTDIDEFQVGDVVECKFHNRGTNMIYDDEIIDVKYLYTK